MLKEDKEKYREIGADWNWTVTPQSLPKPIKEITRDEFMRLMFCGSYSFRRKDYDQTRIPHDKRRLEEDTNGMLRYGDYGQADTHYYLFPHYALAVAEQYCTEKTRKWPQAEWIPYSDRENEPYGFEMRFFKIGCEHTYKELSSQECRARNITHFGTCYHVRECTVCGLIDAYDSSG